MAAKESMRIDVHNALRGINNDEIDGPAAGVVSDLRNFQKEDHLRCEFTPLLSNIRITNTYTLPIVNNNRAALHSLVDQRICRIPIPLRRQPQHHQSIPRNVLDEVYHERFRDHELVNHRRDSGNSPQS